MKIYIVDTTKKMKEIKKAFEDYNLEIKENTKFKMTKNDYAILSDQNGINGEIKNLKNIIILVNSKDYKYIWKLANEYKVIDINDENMESEYISNRIKSIISQ